MSIKINALEIEGVKRIKAVKLSPSESGLTVIGGKNGQGKTSVLDAIAWALGGERFRPGNARRDGDNGYPYMHVELSNGIVVERRGEKSSLTVRDSTGKRSGQTLLNEFIGEFSLDLPKFLEASGKEKADILLGIIGVKEELAKLELREKQLYDERHAIGIIRDRKAKYAEEMPYYQDVPEELISASELIKQQQKILLHNAENEKARNNLQALKNRCELVRQNIDEISSRIRRLEDDLSGKQEEYVGLLSSIEEAEGAVDGLSDESTTELEASIRNIDIINTRIRANNDRSKAQEEAAEQSRIYDGMTDELESVRKAKYELLNGARLPLVGLSCENGELTYNGKVWDCMSSSEQLRVATAIVQRLRPDCGFVLIDKLEQMDVDTLNDFGTWLSERGLQAIATRVSTGDECTVIIEDGEVSGESGKKILDGNKKIDAEWFENI